MAAGNRGADVEMRYSSSPTSLSSPPSGFMSDPGSPSRRLNQGRANIEMDEIVVDTAAGPRFGVMPPQQQQPGVQLTAAGLPRKKPGRKPGTVVKKAATGDASSTTTDAPKVRKPRKPRDPNAPPIQRKRKIAATQEGAAGPEPQKAASEGPAPRQAKITELVSMRMEVDPKPLAPAAPSTADRDQAAPQRETGPSSMFNLLNRDPSPPPPRPTATTRTSGMFDPVRSSSYDPVRETMLSRDPYGTAGLTSPRAPASQLANRASASPSIASLVDPPAAPAMTSPTPSQQAFQHTTTQSRFQEAGPMPPSPPNAGRGGPPAPAPAPAPASKPAAAEARKPVPTSAPSKAPEAPRANGTTTISGVSAPANPTSAPSKKVASVVAQERKEKKASSASSSSPKLGALKNSLSDVPGLPGPGGERSILDFGKANPGEELAAPSIVLHIPLNGETNKYVNFMRMAEEQYGWDALHPRQAAHRERKARIAAASAALEKQGSGRESGDEMSVDLQSDGEGSNVEMGGMGNGGTSGPDGGLAKPARKKRIFKEDEYDKDDDFVDDSELLWEEQAAASRDGFFVYSGPLVPEVEKPAAGADGPPKRGRGGRGSRGGSRGGAASGRGGAEGTGEPRRRGGGPGSRGGVVRKPRATKQEKLDKEKAEKEKLAQAAKSGVGLDVLAATPLFAVGMAVDV